MPSIEYVRKVLFSPFNWRKWAALALIAYLAGVMGGGGGSYNPGGNFGGGTGAPADVEQFGERTAEWVRSHMTETIAAGIGAFLLGLAFVLVMLYVSSVFRFIFLDAVVKNEIGIRRQWRENRAEGLAFMWWRVGFFFVVLLGFLIAVGLPVGLVALLIAQAAQSGGAAPPIVGAVLGGLVAMLMFVLWLIATSLTNALTRDFVLPIMYQRRIGTMDAWRDLWPILTANKMGFFIYFLMKFVCAMGAGIAAFLGMIVALVVAAIPIGALVGIGYGLVLLLGITAWSWSYLIPLVPIGIIVLLALGYWFTCVLLPIPVYFQAYALKYLGSVEPDLQTI